MLTDLRGEDDLDQVRAPKDPEPLERLAETRPEADALRFLAVVEVVGERCSSDDDVEADGHEEQDHGDEHLPPEPMRAAVVRWSRTAHRDSREPPSDSASESIHVRASSVHARSSGV